jgi:hypothetical protein
LLRTGARFNLIAYLLSNARSSLEVDPVGPPA